MTFKKIVGLILMVVGLLVVAFSNKIVFPGLERLIGIEAIVGKENVVYQPDGSYYFTNPKAMLGWVASVAMLGLLIHAVGIWLSGIRIKFPAKKGKDIPN
jgi:ascorbate-specific PTS system EIIC-type component UlaA